MSEMKNNNSLRISEGFKKSLSDVKKSLDKSTDVDDAKKKEYARLQNIRAMRDLDRLDQLVPDIFDAINDLMPELHVVKSVEVFQDTEDSFYIDDDLRLWIHKNIDTPEAARRFFSLCERVVVFTLIGNLIIVNVPEIKYFPGGFPQKVQGDIKLRNLINLRNFNNAPTVIYGGSMPVIDPKSRWIRNTDVDKYIESLKDKMDNPVNVFNILRMTKNETNESMSYNEIKQRFLLGQRFLNENFPKDFFIKKPVRPQEPKFSKPLPEPNRDDFPEGEDGDRQYYSELRKYNAIKTKRDRASSRYQADLDEYENVLKPLYNKNIELFHEFVTPLIDAGWGSISDDDVKKYDDFSKIHTDLTANSAKFQGIKIFSDDHNNLTLIYAQTLNDSKPRIVYFINSDGDVITNPSEISKEINERATTYNKIDKYFTNIGLTYSDLARKHKTVREQFLYLLWWMLAPAVVAKKEDLGSGKGFTWNNVVYNPNGLGEIDWFDECLKDIFGRYGKYRENQDNVSYTVPYYPRYINFGGGKNNSAKYAGDFTTIANSYILEKNPDFNPANWVSDDIIRVILIALSIRAEYEGRPVFSIDDVLNADRSMLVDMASQVLDVDVYSSALKYMAFRSKDDERFNSSVANDNGFVKNPQDVLLLFPDRCRVEYVIDTDIKKSVIDNYTKRNIRTVQKAGMYNPPKITDYDYRTHERKERDRVKKKISLDSTPLDQFEHFSTYYKTAKMNGINKIVKSAIEKYNDKSRYSANKKLYNIYTNAISEIKGYPDIIVDEISNKPDKNYDVEINELIDLYIDIEEAFEKIYASDPEKDYMEIKSLVDFIISQSYKIRDMYARIAEIQSYRQIQSLGNIISKNDRKKNTEAGTDTLGNKQYDVSKFSQLVDELKKNHTKVMRILNGAFDFSKSNDEAIDEFGDKKNLVKFVKNRLDSIIKYADELINVADGDKISRLESDYKNANDILHNIIVANNDKDEPDADISAYVVELKYDLRNVAKEAMQYMAQSAQTATTA